MKLLCLSDTVDPAVYNENIRRNFAAVDAVLCAGDVPMDYLEFIVSNLNVPTLFVFGNHHTRETARSFGDPYSRKNKSDRGEVFPAPDSQGAKLPRSRARRRDYHHGALRTGFIHQRLLIKGQRLLVAGAPGCMCYNHGDFQFTEAKMRRLLRTLVPGLIWNKVRYGRYLDVFLTHAPPEGIHDLADTCHRGFHCFRTFLDRFKPALHVHGHIHRYGNDAPRSTPCGPTTVINAYDHYTLDFTPLNPKEGIAHE